MIVMHDGSRARALANSGAETCVRASALAVHPTPAHLQTVVCVCHTRFEDATTLILSVRP